MPRNSPIRIALKNEYGYNPFTSVQNHAEKREMIL